MSIKTILQNLFTPKPPKYRIYCHRWRIVDKEDGTWDVADDEEYPTPFASNNNGILLYRAYRLRTLKMKQNESFCYNFYVDKNKDPNAGWIRP